MKIVKITTPEGFEIDKDKSTFEEIVFKPIKKELPKRWEHLGRVKGYFTDGYCNIFNDRVLSEHSRKNIFTTEEQAKASIALAQLSQLREVYRQGWVPDWKSNNQIKHAIINLNGNIYENSLYRSAHFLSFQSEQVRNEFLRNFKDLIEEASPLLFG